MHFHSLVLLAAAIVGSSASLSAEPASGRSFKELLREAKEGSPTQLEEINADSYAVSRHAAHHAQPEVHRTLKFVDGRTSEIRYRRILLISWFRRRGRIAIRYSVSDDRHSRSVIDVFNWAHQASGDEVLSQEKMDSLKALLPVLPRSDADPPIHHAVLVSRQVGAEWRTDTYDGAKLPDTLEKIFKIIGEREETRSRHNPPVAVPVTGNGRVLCPACRDTIAVDKVNGACVCGQRIVLGNPPPRREEVARAASKQRRNGDIAADALPGRLLDRQSGWESGRWQAISARPARGQHARSTSHPQDSEYALIRARDQVVHGAVRLLAHPGLKL